MQVIIESYMRKQIEAMLDKDKKQIESMANTDKEIFEYHYDPDCLNRIILEYDESGLNFFMKGVLFQGIKFKIKQIDRNAKIRKI